MTKINYNEAARELGQSIVSAVFGYPPRSGIGANQGCDRYKVDSALRVLGKAIGQSINVNPEPANKWVRLTTDQGAVCVNASNIFGYIRCIGDGHTTVHGPTGHFWVIETPEQIDALVGVK